jgi:peptidoglycan/xylan/chitin deacetylase (PgdA/CDA1 family)
MWSDTLAFSDEMKKEGAPLHFTYFINSSYLLAPQNSYRYISPNGDIGKSAIGFSEDLYSINERIKEINKALSQGHEIASHAVGHWSGGVWSTEEWRRELVSFSNLLLNFKENNPQKVFDESLDIGKLKIKGFRAPELSINDNMYKALALEGYSYDSSGVNIRDIWPYKDQNNIWRIPISTVYFKELNKRIIAVDYSIWVHQTANKNILLKGTDAWNNALKDIVLGYMNHFNKDYAGSRAPMVIDNHFSLWNDGLYWEAMKKFAREICGKTDVRCSTFSELVRYMEIKENERGIGK